MSDMHERPPNFAEVVCRVCGGGRHLFLCQTFNEHSQTKVLDNYLCEECGSVFIGNQIGIDELAVAYSTIDEAAYYNETAEASAEKFSRAAHELLKFVQPSADLLDIGGGNGAFARALNKHGFSKISIHEIPGSQVSLPDFTHHVFRDFDYNTIPTASFDIVTMMDVMEHVPDPGHTLSAVRRVLRPGGLLYMHTPVVSLLDRIMHVVQKLPAIGGIGRVWQRARTSIFHLQNYTQHSLSLLMERHGFEIIRIICLNELSWPIKRYVRVYLVEKTGLPEFMVPIVSLLLLPILKSRLNANKSITIARSVISGR